MPDLDSLSFALLVPFAVCFILIFVVCCFADEIKDICRLPSPLPSTYIGGERTTSRRRHQRRHSQRHERRRAEQRTRREDAQGLILNEEGRSRNVSESSQEFASQPTVIIVHEQMPSASGLSFGNEAHLNDAASSSSSKVPDITLVADSSATVCESERNFSKNLSLGLQTHSACCGNTEKQTTSGFSETNSLAEGDTSSASGPHCHNRHNTSVLPLTEALTAYLTPDKQTVTSLSALSELPSSSIDNRANQSVDKH